MMLVVGEHLLGEIPPLVQRMTSALCGGIGDTMQDACGALTSGVLIISSLLGRATSAEDDSQAIKLAAQYRERFLAEMGHTNCRAVRDRVLATGHPQPCSYLVVEKAAAILLELLGEQA